MVFVPSDVDSALTEVIVRVAAYEMFAKVEQRILFFGQGFLRSDVVPSAVAADIMLETILVGMTHL